MLWHVVVGSLPFTTVSDESFLHTMPGYCYLTPGWDISILHPPIALAPMLSYPTELLLYDNNNKQVQLHKLPKTTIIFRIIDSTIRFNNAKIETHALGSICVRRDILYGIHMGGWN